MENQEKWLNHARLAQNHPKGFRSYCRENQISINALSYWRNKLRDSLNKDVPQRAPFIPVQVITSERKCRGNQLPDPKWVAELILRLSEGVNGGMR